MAAALALAGRGLGSVWPNPSVGCVIVAPEGRVVGRGSTGLGGRPHAETQALAMAGAAAVGATAYVSLEPCSHWGQTPPCADALISARVARVVIATIDPDARVSGRGADMLREAGITVDVGVLADRAKALYGGFFMNRIHGRPLVTLKLSSTLDGRIATATGQSQWITGPKARAHVHALRARHDAIMVGSRTALADDPELTVRLPGISASAPVSLVIDSQLVLPAASKLAKAALGRPVWVVTGPAADRDKAAELSALGVEIIEVGLTSHYKLDLMAAFQALGGRGLTSVMVEGGAGLAAALLQAHLVDRVIWFRAPTVMGADGLAAIEVLGHGDLAALPGFTRQDAVAVGTDLMETYTKI